VQYSKRDKRSGTTGQPAPREQPATMAKATAGVISAHTTHHTREVRFDTGPVLHV